MVFTNEDLFKLVLIYGQCTFLQRTCDVFHQRYPDKPVPTAKMLRKILENLKNHGSFKTKIKKHRPVIDDDNTNVTVLAYFIAYPRNSISDAERDIGFKYSSIQRILKKNKFKPYKINIVHHLKETDFPRRIQFCEWLWLRYMENNDFLSQIIWSDESKFTKNGMFNKHNEHFWASENPRAIQETNFQDSWSFNVYCAIKDSRIIILKFYDENLNG